MPLSHNMGPPCKKNKKHTHTHARTHTHAIDTTLLRWWPMFMGIALDLRVKPLDIGIIVLHVEIEVRVIEHNSSHWPMHILDSTFLEWLLKCTCTHTTWSKTTRHHMHNMSPKPKTNTNITLPYKKKNSGLRRRMEWRKCLFVEHPRPCPKLINS